MSPSLKQFVPSEVCLACDGCCRFQLADSPWRPKAGDQEILEGVDPQGYLKATLVGTHYQCIHFNSKDHTCGVYAQRPFECSLYPFILSKTKQGLKMYVHLACPYIQEQETKEELAAHIKYVQDYFNQSHIKDFLRNNSRLLHDYSQFESELRFLFDIGE